MDQFDNDQPGSPPAEPEEEAVLSGEPTHRRRRSTITQRKAIDVALQQMASAEAAKLAASSGEASELGEPSVYESIAGEGSGRSGTRIQVVPGDIHGTYDLKLQHIAPEETTTAEQEGNDLELALAMSLVDNPNEAMDSDADEHVDQWVEDREKQRKQAKIKTRSAADFLKRVKKNRRTSGSHEELAAHIDEALEAEAAVQRQIESQPANVAAYDVSKSRPSPKQQGRKKKKRKKRSKKKG